MATCRYCGRGGFLQRVDNEGLCDRCSEPVRLVIKSHARVALESLELAQHGKTHATRMKRWDLAIGKMEALLEYEQRGINTTEPPPSAVLPDMRLRRQREAESDAPDNPPVPRSPTYANTTCPYCGVHLDPLPKAKKKCPSCGESIRVRSGPDGFTYLLQEADLPVLEQAWAEYHEAQAQAKIEERVSAGREAVARTIAHAIGMGLQVEIMTSDDACPACRPLDGRLFDPRMAPAYPVPGCTSEFCRCDFTAVWPDR